MGETQATLRKMRSGIRMATTRIRSSMDSAAKEKAMLTGECRQKAKVKKASNIRKTLGENLERVTVQKETQATMRKIRSWIRSSRMAMTIVWIVMTWVSGKTIRQPQRGRDGGLLINLLPLKRL